MKYKLANSTASLSTLESDSHSSPNYQADELYNTTDTKKVSNLLASSLSVLLAPVPEASNSIKIQAQSQPSYSKLLEVLPWAYDFYTSARELDSSKKLLPYYKEINKLVHFSSTEEINDFLYYVNTEHISDVLLPGLLRLTSSKKEELMYWKDLKTRVEKELEQRGYDKVKLLRGLD